MNFISFRNHNQAFPLHFHEEYCISLIKDGVELLNVNNELYEGKVDDITITHPYELHSNPMFSAKNPLSFDTIYLSIADYTSFNGKEELVHFPNRIIQDKRLKELFIKSIEEANSTALSAFLSHLSDFGKVSKKLNFSPPLEHWHRLEDFLDQNIHVSVSIDDMAAVVHLNKFSFSRKFKKSTGISPAHYALMKKVFHCRDLITPNSSLTELAYDFDFTDLSHFSNCFKKFIGINPTSYQESLVVE